MGVIARCVGKLRTLRMLDAGVHARRYVGKLRGELEEGAFAVFSGAAERERAKSVLADLAKTASDFKAITGRALDTLSSAIVPRLRCCCCMPPLSVSRTTGEMLSSKPLLDQLSSVIAPRRRC